METIIVIIIAFGLGLLAGYAIWRRVKTSRNKKQEQAKNAKLRAVLEYAKKHRRITNDVVQSVAGVSDATATRYLDEFEARGSLKQVGGSSGAHVYYQYIE